MAYQRARLGGDADKGLAVATTGGSVINIVNWGVSVLTNSSAEVYVLAPPTAGCEKTLAFSSSSTTALAVKLSTNTAQTVTVLAPTGSTYTCIKKSAAASTNALTVVQLKGLNSTSWLITSVWPASTAPSASNYGGSITLSTT